MVYMDGLQSRHCLDFPWSWFPIKFRKLLSLETNHCYTKCMEYTPILSAIMIIKIATT